MRIIGIDPGLSGAIAVLDWFSAEGYSVQIFDMPTKPFFEKGFVTRAVDLEALRRLLREECKFDTIPVVIERVHSMSGQGVASMFSMGMSFWGAAGVAVGLGNPLHLVDPQEWKKHFELSRDKDASLKLARTLWPSLAGKELKRAKDHNRAEALLIAEWYRRQWEQTVHYDIS